MHVDISHSLCAVYSLDPLAKLLIIRICLLLFFIVIVALCRRIDG